MIYKTVVVEGETRIARLAGPPPPISVAASMPELADELDFLVWLECALV
jgi:hypothetical protein